MDKPGLTGATHIFGGSPPSPRVDAKTLDTRIGEAALEKGLLAHTLTEARLLSANR